MSNPTEALDSKIDEILDEYENGQNPHQSEDYRLDKARNAIKDLLLEAQTQIAMNMQVQWKQERLNHTLSVKASEWKRELEHYDEFSKMFIAELQALRSK